MRAPASSAARSPRLPARTETRDTIDFVLGKNDLKTWFRFCGTMFSLVVSKSSHRVCRLQAAKPTGCFYMPYAHDMREKPVRREIVEFIRPADNRPLLRKPWLFRRIALQQRGPMLLFACKGAYGPRRLWARSSTSGSMKNPWRMPSFSAMSIFMRRVCTSSKRTNREPLSVR